MARIAMIMEKMFEDAEFRVPYDRLREAGHQVDIIGAEEGKEIEGKKGKEKVKADRGIGEVSAEEYDALVIPGGYSPDKLRMNMDMVRLTREMFTDNKPMGVICHAPWMLVEADVADGRTLTSYPSLKTDLINAGARWIDREVVEDGNLITSRNPGDLDAFCEAILRQVEQGVPERPEPPRAPEATSETRPELH